MNDNLNFSELTDTETKWRESLQPLLPPKLEPPGFEGYSIYPFQPIGPGNIHSGYEGLAKWMSGYRRVAIDGYTGVFWEDVRRQLTEQLDMLGLTVRWICTSDFLKPAAELEPMLSAFLGTEGSVWGKKCSLSLMDFYSLENFPEPAGEGADLGIVIGEGAAAMSGDCPLVYIDLPKNELQYRMRAGSIRNLGSDRLQTNTESYKRFYFVDWPLLNEHKKNILPHISVFADGQWKDTINWALAEPVRRALSNMSQTVFRVRPWFEAGAWGGQWMKERISGLNKEEPNLAWSFELIVPENGLVFESDGYLLELSFDFLMFAGCQAVLGRHADRFGYEFPIRFDFLDTWDGGNLSIQCHPQLSYIQQHFGERITQDETYYILDCQDEASVYLGFQENIEPVVFRQELENSRDKGLPIEITKYVQCHPARKHDLFLIPNGTVHSAGAGNLVLEISATPYIFTFKMYDWLRLDLNGKPRPINIEHAFENLRFDRKGSTVAAGLISVPRVLEEGEDFRIVHLPTHEDHFYDVHRLEFDTAISIETQGSCQVLMLVEGTEIELLVGGLRTVFKYAETFVIPAAANSCTLINKGRRRTKVIKAFLKDESLTHS